MVMVQIQAQKRRIVFLNALPMGAFGGMQRVMFEALHVDDLKSLAKWVRERVENGYEVVNYVRHVSTVEALKRLGFPITESNAGVYRYLPGDLLIIAILKNPVRNGSEVAVKEEDIDVWVVNPLV
jgi:hypothetical protein